ncbi:MULTISPECIES: MFS transporter [unclassified Leptolyngbya]|uniref:MFS transporter n=1 Tax=unclassified Leptolyngbya TaxID=2650499 RepID=UPI0016863452|nr:MULTISPECIES: MFS transporter [unclassified Leptolyngbya]MBD1910974.1 MFS transporter [Leptolyngbya sp. FACHB-8]MBD2158359.1 MFS transporter [Leptolyngbya sp. FACHB-16]
MSTERSIQFSLLLLAGCLTTMTGGIVAPVFPEMVQELGLNPRWAGTLLSIHALTSALMTPIMGLLADRIGKMKVMIPSLILYSFFGISTAFLTSFPLLLASRALLGAASGGIAAATIGILSSMYEGESRSRVLGFATSAMTTSAILFPLLGGWVGKTHWQYSFYLYGAGVILLSFMLVVFNGISSKVSGMMPSGGTSELRTVLKQPQIWRIYGLIGVAATVVYTVVIYTPLYLKAAIGAGPELNGFVLAIRAVGAAIVAAVGAAWVAKRLGENRAIALGFSLMATTIFTIPLLTHLSLIVPAAILFGIGFGIITPNLYNVLAGHTPPELRASVLGIGTGFNSLGQFICPWLLGPVWKYAGLHSVFFAATALAVLASFISLTHPKTS